MTAQEAFAAMVQGQIAPQLEREGFTQTAATSFHRAVGRNWELVSLQPTQVQGADHVKLSVSLGVAIERLRGGTLDWEDGERPAAHECHFARRLGPLLTGREVFWDVHPDTDVLTLGETICEAISRYGLPWLEARSDDERLRNTCLEDLSAVPWWELRPLRDLVGQLGPDEARSALDAELRRRAAAEES